MRRILLVTALAFTGLASVPAAHAAHVTTVVNFEGIPQFTEVRDQYAGQGVLFGPASRFGLPTPPDTCSTGGDARTGGIGGTTSANIACSSGPSEFPVRRFATAFEFDVERRQLSFKIEPRVASSTNLPATMRVYGIGGLLLEERPLALTRNVTTTVSVSRGTPDVTAIVVFGGLDPGDSGPVLIDDLQSLLDDVPPPPKWSLALSTPSIEVVEGATATATLSIRRFNGSTGPVTLSVPELPPGISATLIDPNPANGRDPVQLRVTAARPMTGPRQITVNASGGGPAGTGVVTQGVQTVTGVPAVEIAAGGRFTRTLAAGCGPQRFDESFTVRGGLSTNVSLSPVGAGGLGASADPASVFTAGDGLYRYGLLVDPGSASGIQSVRLRTFPSGATPAELETFYRVAPVTVAGISPTTLGRPALGQTGRVFVRGTFPGACVLKFQDGQGQDWRILERGSTEVDGQSFDLWTLEVPANATSGPLRVLSPTNAEVARTAPLDITEFRNTFGFSQGNSGPGARTASYSWADFERTFGTDDTEACFVFCVRDPVASDYYDTFRAQVTANPGQGLCAGWSIMALRFSQFLGEQRPSDYQAGVRRAWQLNPVSDGTSAKRDVVRWHVSQFDKFFQEARTRGFARSAADERALLREASRVGGLYVGIRQGTSGHAVVAHQVQEITTPTGPGLTVAIYDPNVPYSTAEETSSATRTTALTNSTITIQGNGNWSGAGFPWSGNNGTLAVIDPLPSSDAKLPSDFSLASVFGSADGSPPAQVASIESGGRQLLDGSGEPRAGSGVVLQPAMSGAGPVPQYRLTQGRQYTFGLRGTTAGRYTHSVIGDGASAGVSGAATAPGRRDEVTVRAGAAELEFESASGSKVTYRVADDRGKVTRTATIATTAPRGGGDEVELSGTTLRVRHTGAAAAATITLASVGEGLPGAVTTAPVRLRAGQRLDLKPRSWRDLGAGLRATVRDRRGRVVRRGTVALRASRRVGLGAVRARRAGRRITVTGRVTRRGSAPVLAVVVEQVRGGKVMARTAATRRGARVRAGRFSLPVTVRRRAGTRLRVSVTLVDEGADLATARRRVAVG